MLSVVSLLTSDDVVSLLTTDELSPLLLLIVSLLISPCCPFSSQSYHHLRRSSHHVVSLTSSNVNSNHQIADEPTTNNLNATDFYIQQVTLKSSALDVKVFRGFTNSAKEYVLEQQALDNVVSETQAIDYIMKNYHPNGDYMHNTPYYEPESYFMAIYNGTESDDTLSFTRPNGIVGVVSAQLRRKAPLIAGSSETTQTVLPSVPLPSPHVYVANMRVDTKMQRKGIAMALLTAVKDYATAWSVATHSNEGIPIILSVDNVNLPATALYEKFGFSYLEQNAVFRMMIMWPGKERNK